MPFDLLKKRLMSRLDAMGVRILEVYEEVASYGLISIFVSLADVSCNSIEMLNLDSRNGPIFLLEGPYRTQTKKTLHLVLQLVWCILQPVQTSPQFELTVPSYLHVLTMLWKIHRILGGQIFV